MHNKPIVFFDGVCNLCSSSVQFILKHDKKNSFYFASLQGETAKIKLKDFFDAGNATDSIILMKEDSIYSKSTAVIQIARQLVFPYNLATVFLILPSFMRDPFYDIIAKNRYKWFGKKEECWLPSAEHKLKFLP